MNRTQQKYLEERINNIAQQKSYVSWYLVTPDPVKIAKARASVTEYDAEKRKKQDKITAQVRKAKQDLLDTLYFKDEKEILEAIKAFEEITF